MFRNDCQQRIFTVTNSSFHHHGIYKFHKYHLRPLLSHAESFNEYNFNKLYGLVYSCTFFVVIILLPICVVSVMYWKIFSAAKQNGQRMRQNGSSPLLQSALNLAVAPPLLPSINNLHLISERKPLGLNQQNNNNQSSALNNERRHTADYSDMRMNVKEFKKFGELSKSNIRAEESKYRQYLDTTARGDCGIHMNAAASDSASENSQNYEIVANKHNLAIDTCELNEPGCELHQHANRINTSLYQLPIKEYPDTFPEQNHCHAKLLPTINNVYDFRYVHSSPNLQKLIIQSTISKTASIPSHFNRSDFHLSEQEFSVHAPSICVPPKALSYMSSIRHRLSNASSIFKYREESRTARISILVIILFLMSYFPYGIMVVVERRIHLIENASLLETIFLLTANICFPCMFAYRNKRVRRGVCRLFGVDAKTNERLQKRRAIQHKQPSGGHAGHIGRLANPNAKPAIVTMLISNVPNQPTFQSTVSEHSPIAKVCQNTQRGDINCNLNGNNVLLIGHRDDDEDKQCSEHLLKCESVNQTDDGYSSAHIGNDSDG